MPKPKPSLNMTRPSTAKSKAAPQNGKAKIVQGTTRLVVDMPTDLHRRLKLKAVLNGKKIREYVLDLLARDGLS